MEIFYLFPLLHVHLAIAIAIAEASATLKITKKAIIQELLHKEYAY